jgi:zinc protease
MQPKNSMCRGPFMKRILLVFSVVVIGGCGASPTRDESPVSSVVVAGLTDGTLPWDSTVRRGVLPNGLSYFIEANQTPKSRAELRLVVKVGSIMEDPDQLGLAHFVEHMAFNGSTHFTGNQLIDTMERFGMGFGAHLNAYTSFDETVYKLQIPTEPALLKKGFLVLRDWAGGLTFDAKEIEKERGVVLDEWRRSRGAGGRLRDAFIPLQFKDSQYAKRLPIGTEKSLQTFTREQATRFYRDWYRPDLMAIVAVGDFDVDVVEQEIKSRFADLVNPAPTRLRTAFQVPAYAKTLVGIKADPEVSATMVTSSQIQDERRATTVLEYRAYTIKRMAIGMFNSRLSELGKRADAPFRFAGAGQSRINPNQLSQTLTIVPFEGRLSEGHIAGLKAFRRVQKFGFTQSELLRKKTGTRTYFERAQKEVRTEKSSAAAAELIRHFTTNETVPGIHAEAELMLKIIPTITLADVDSAIKRLFVDGGRLIMVALPEKEGLKVPSAADIRKDLKIGSDDSGLTPYVDVVAKGPLVKEPPQGGRVIKEVADPVLETVEWTLSNGIKVILKPTPFDDNNLSFVAWRVGGHSLVSDADFQSASSAAGLSALSGAGPFDRITLPKRMVGKRASASLGISTLRFNLSGSSVVSDIDTMFELMWLRATEPRIDADVFAQFKKRAVERLRNRHADPSTAFGDTYSKILWQDHYRKRPLSQDRIDRLDLQKARDYLKGVTADWSGTTFMFVGKIDLKTIKPKIEQWVGGLPTSGGAEPAFKDVGIRAAKGVHRQVVRRGIEPKAQVRIRMSGDFKSVPRQRYALRALGRVLSMRLREVLREEKGGTYSAGASVSMSHDPNQSYGISISFTCEPGRAEELTKATWEIIESLKTRPVNESYTAKIAAQQAREDEVEKRRNRYWSSVIMSSRARREPTSALVEYWDLHRELTPELVFVAAKKYLDTKRVVQVTLLPQEQTETKATQ